MSAFCVFGVSLSDCKKKARKTVKDYGVGDFGKKIKLTLSEWNDRVDAETKRLFDATVRRKSISAAFDAPQFAQEYIDIGLKSKSIRHPRIMVRGVKIDDKGAPVLRKGKEVITWVPYQP